MKLLFLVPQLPYPPRQGTTIRNFNLIKELAPRHTVDLLTFLAPGEQLSAGNRLHQLCRRVAALPQPMRTLRRRGEDTLLSPQPDMGLRLESADMHALVTAWVQQERYDVVQVEGIELAQYGSRVAGRKHGWGGLHCPALVFDDHNCEYLLQQRNALTDLHIASRWPAAVYSLIQWQKLRRYEAACLRAADATLAVSVADKAALERLAPDVEVVVVSNGIDLSAYRWQMNEPSVDPPRLVFTGKMDYRPNIDAALWFGCEVLPLILEREPQARFQIVGMNPHPRLDGLRSRPNVEITGWVEDTRPFIYGAAAYVIPMRVGGGTRFKALEAMACGQAVVSTALGIEGIPIRSGQEMLVADTPGAFAEASLKLIADARQGSVLHRQLGDRARRFVETYYSWKKIVPMLEEVYQRIVA